VQRLKGSLQAALLCGQSERHCAAHRHSFGRAGWDSGTQTHGIIRGDAHVARIGEAGAAQSQNMQLFYSVLLLSPSFGWLRSDSA